MNCLDKEYWITVTVPEIKEPKKRDTQDIINITNISSYKTKDNYTSRLGILRGCYVYKMKYNSYSKINKYKVQ